MTEKQHIERFLKVFKAVVPKAYQPLIMIWLFKSPSLFLGASGRGAGKSQLLAIMGLLLAELEPLGTITFLRDTIKQNKESNVPTIEYWKKIMGNDYNSMLDWNYSGDGAKEIIHSRRLKSGVIQKINYIGYEMGGVNKKKSSATIEHGYYSALLRDEGENLGEKLTEEERILEFEMYNTLVKSLHRSRRFAKYQKAPRLREVNFFNPKKEGSWQNELYEKYLDPFIYSDMNKARKILETEGIIWRYYPDYNGGNGLLLFQSSLYALINDPNPNIKVAEDEVNKMMWAKEHNPREYDTDYIGFRLSSPNAIFSNINEFNRHLPAKEIPLTLGFDYGARDYTASIITGAGLYYDNSIDYNNIFHMYEYRTDGIKKKGALTDKDHRVWEEDMAVQILKNLEDNIFNYLPWYLYYETVNRFIISHGPGAPDRILARTITEKLNNEFSHLKHLIVIKGQSEKSEGKFNTDGRTTFLKHHLVKTGVLSVFPEWTPMTAKGYLSLVQKDGKTVALKEYQDVVDAAWYSISPLLKYIHRR